MDNKPMSYAAMHMWVVRELGLPKKCQYCQNEYEGRNMHWANLSGEYKEELDDWLRLCRWCHKKYDNPQLYFWDNSEWHKIKRDSKKTFIIRLEPEQRNQIKLMSCEAGKTMNQFIIDRIFNSDRISRKAVLEVLKDLMTGKEGITLSSRIVELFNLFEGVEEPKQSTTTYTGKDKNPVFGYPKSKSLK